MHHPLNIYKLRKAVASQQRARKRRCREADVARDLQRLIQARQLCFLIALTPPLARWWLVATPEKIGANFNIWGSPWNPAHVIVFSYGTRKPWRGPRAASNRTRPRSSSLTTEIYNEFPVQPGRKFARARPLVPTTLHKRYRRRIAHSDLKQPFRQCGDAFVAVHATRAERLPLHTEKYIVRTLERSSEKPISAGFFGSGLSSILDRDGAAETVKGCSSKE